jgi:outer membrane lipoprotein-sorting protein
MKKAFAALLIASVVLVGCAKKEEPQSGEPKPTPQQAGGAASAPAGGMKEFSADVKTTMPGGQTSNGKIYVGAGKMRMEMNAAGQQSVTIFDSQAKTGWVLMPQQKMYMEMKQQNELAQVANQSAGDDPCANLPNSTCRRAGEENVNGRNTVKWEIAMNQGGQQSTITQWFDPSIGFVVRQQTSEGMTMDVTNIQTGAQPASLFELPAGYKKLSVPGR